MFFSIPSLCSSNGITKRGPETCSQILVNDCAAFIDARAASGGDGDWLVVYDTERLAGAPLLGAGSYVRHLADDPCIVDCEAVAGRAFDRKEAQALATEPCELVAELPPDHKPGQAVLAQGPFGSLEVLPHAAERPGVVRYPLRPDPEFRIEVPPGKKSGDTLRFRRDDGQAVTLSVPEGLAPGDSFDVIPPVTMVLVPDGSVPGDLVVFQASERKWWRATIPRTLKYGKFFAARLPGPNLGYVRT